MPADCWTRYRGRNLTSYQCKRQGGARQGASLTEAGILKAPLCTTRLLDASGRAQGLRNGASCLLSAGSKHWGAYRGERGCGLLSVLRLVSDSPAHTCTFLWNRKWQPIPYSHLGNSMDRRAWRPPVHEVAKSWTRLSMHAGIHFLIFPISRQEISPWL